ncbi:MAG: hypothetical protein SGILL_008055 [Bacillariaceae sp.]
MSVGKTSFVKHFLMGEFNENHPATAGVAVGHLTFYNNKYGAMKFKVCDVSAGQELPRGRKEEDCNDGHCAIIMFDPSLRITYSQVPGFYRDLTEFSVTIPITLVGNNKVNKTADPMTKHNITFHKVKPNMEYFEISVKEKTLS